MRFIEGGGDGLPNYMDSVNGVLHYRDSLLPEGMGIAYFSRHYAHESVTLKSRRSDAIHEDNS